MTRRTILLFLLAVVACAVPAVQAKPNGPGGIRGLPVLPGLETNKDAPWGPLVPEYGMEITASGPSPADLTNRGLYQLQLFRSPQSARHFLAALRQDNHCPMAWFGLYLALLERGEEAKPARDECARRAPTLRDRAKPHEKAWIDAMAALHQRGPRGFATALQSIRQSNPIDMNSRIWLPLMLRDGYDDAGKPLPGQQAAEALIRIQLDKRPGDPVVLHAWCQLALAGPKPDQALGQAHLLLSLGPPSAYFQQAAGLVLFRCGEMANAAKAFDAARKFDEDSMTAEGIAPIAAPTYFDNLDCLAIALVECGRRDAALAVARAAKGIELPWSLPNAAANREFAFFTLTAEARVHARCRDWQKALDALPPADHPALAASRFASLWVELLRAYLQGRVAAGDGTQAQRQEALRKTESLLAAMGEATKEAKADGLEPQWSEAFRLADFLQYDLRAESKFQAGDSKSAAGWWRSATLRQAPPVSRAVPRWPAGGLESLAESNSRGRDPATGVSAWEQLAREKPKSGWAMRGLRDARQRSGDDAGARKANAALNTLWPDADDALLAKPN